MEVDSALSRSSYAGSFHYRDPADRRGLPGLSDLTTEYVGPMADEAPWAMHYDGSVLNPINALGYTVLAIQALDGRIETHEQKIIRLETRVAELEGAGA